MKHLSWFPLICYGLVLVYACYAAAVVGHWPYYAHPDPKNLPWPELVNVAMMIVLAGMASVVIVPLSYAVYRSVAAWRGIRIGPHGKVILIFCIGALLWIGDVAAEFADLPWRSLAGWVAD